MITAQRLTAVAVFDADGSEPRAIEIEQAVMRVKSEIEGIGGVVKSAVMQPVNDVHGDGKR
ncbi:hypothetical protein LCGC14_2627420 [marine sediment metagenome]|uniref:Uncharacterized protein n=1 Tax=marine sediment metagenome TaxID=412755 RepID=A0A0F9A1E7_9ZZZZ